MKNSTKLNRHQHLTPFHPLAKHILFLFFAIQNSALFIFRSSLRFIASVLSSNMFISQQIA